MAQRKLMQGLVSRIAIGVFGLLTVAMILLAIFDDRGALAIREKRQQLERINNEIDEATQKNEEIQTDVKALRGDPHAIEKRAREQLKLVKPGEIVIQMPDNSTPSK